MGNHPHKGLRGEKGGDNKYYSKRDMLIIREQLKQRDREGQKGPENPGGSIATVKPRSNSLNRVQKGGGRRTMEDGSDEHKAGLEAMGKKKGITPSGSAANLHQARETKAP
jgi:hypothetical protein